MTLKDLIDTRSIALSLSEAALTEAIDIRNPIKAQAFLARVRDDRMKGMEHMRRDLATALAVSLEEVDAAIDASRQARWARFDAEWRTAFVPHAMLTTTNRIPQPIFAAAMTGATEKLRIDLPEAVPRVNWPRWVADRLPPGLGGFGRVTGFALNYTPDCAVFFDRDANPLREETEAYRRGTASLRGLSPKILS